MVKKALESQDGAESADVSKKMQDAVPALSRDVDDAAARKAVEDKDYKITDIIEL